MSNSNLKSQCNAFCEVWAVHSEYRYASVQVDLGGASMCSCWFHVALPLFPFNFSVIPWFNFVVFFGEPKISPTQLLIIYIHTFNACHTLHIHQWLWTNKSDDQTCAWNSFNNDTGCASQSAGSTVTLVFGQLTNTHATCISIYRCMYISELSIPIP